MERMIWMHGNEMLGCTGTRCLDARERDAWTLRNEMLGDDENEWTWSDTAL
ncbi:MAG: hypothetical protein LBT50_05895 [Prevotellaceae bacterium]|nr:hypothetical protein [Prevotellaceae bacterium]